MPDLDYCHECSKLDERVRELRQVIWDMSKEHKEELENLYRALRNIGGGLMNFPGGIKAKTVMQQFKDADGNITSASIPVDEDGKPIVLVFENGGEDE